MLIETITFKNKIYTAEDFIQFIIDNYNVGPYSYRNDEITKDITAVNNFKLGDLIIAYHKGYHEIVDFDFRLNNSYNDNLKSLEIIVEYKNKFNSDGEIRNGKVKLVCSLYYVKHAKEYIVNVINNLNNILQSNTK